MPIFNFSNSYMQIKFCFSLVLLIICITATTAQPGRRFDTTMKLGKAGYKVFTTNKSLELNSLTVNPIGFEKDAREATVQIKGRVNKAEVDDLNNDGFPELVMYVVNPGKKERSTVFGISSQKNEGFLPIYFPDVYDDQKLRVGYDGHDQYSLMEGTLVRRFPLYNTTDTANITPTGMIRQVQYRIVTGERGELKFKVVRSYDYAKQ